MQLTYRYLATNKSVLIADLTNNITEYRPVYQRNMTVYRMTPNGIYDLVMDEVLPDADEEKAKKIDDGRE